jgi:hypothetical protein
MVSSRACTLFGPTAPPTALLHVKANPIVKPATNALLAFAALCALFLLALGHSGHAVAGPVTKIEALGALTAPSTLVYGNAFNDLNPVLPGVQIAPAGVPITLNATDNFHDQYAFTVGTVRASFITLTIDLANIFNIDSLTVQLYDATGLASPALGAESLLSARSPIARSAAVASGGPGEQQVIAAFTLVAGTYVLDVQGLVTGVFGGSYSGVANLSAVPEPGGLPLVLLALVLSAAAGRGAVQTDHARLRHHAYGRHPQK